MKLSMLNTLAAAAALVAAGCANDTGYSDNFFKNSDHHAVKSLLHTQAANGAREDGTLSSAHFTGAELNSLGQQKLELMADGPVNRDLVVYLDLPAGDAGTAARREAVTRFLVAGGLDASHVKIEAGANPNVTAPAAGNLARYSKTESESTMSSASGGSSVPMSK
jgi:hypothetical protein